MITRPLDLSSRLRPAPHGYEFVFYLNAGLIALFFVLFGSRFVLSPGLGVDFSVPVMPAALEGAVSTDVVVSVKGANLAFVEGAKVDFAGLRSHLNERAKGVAGLRLLVQADASLTTRDLTEVYDMAREAGFASVQIAAEPQVAR
jgi:biopolymer transport protein ExbD